MPAADRAPTRALGGHARDDALSQLRAPAERVPAIVDEGPAGRLLLKSASDELLAREVQLGSDAAFQIIYERHSPGLRKLCRRMLRSPEDAEDALQESLASAWSSMRAADADLPRQMRPWLYAVAQNRCRSMLRDRVPHGAAFEDPPETTPYDEQVQSRSELRLLLADVCDLPVLQRQALVLSELRGLSHAEVADRLGHQPSRVKSLVFEARATLAVWREARDTPCDEIRQQLARLRGGALRRRVLRRHLQLCESCRTYHATERARRRPLSILPRG